MSNASQRNTFLAFSIVLLLPLAFYAYFEIKKQTTGLRMPELPVLSLDSLPDFSLITHTGDSIHRHQLDSSIVIADFFFTTCPGICPALSRSMARIQKYVDGHPNIKSKVQLLSFTVDPSRDSVEVLKEYAERYDNNPEIWKFITGPESILYPLSVSFFKLPAMRAPEESLEPFVHSEKLVLLDKSGFIRGYYNGTDSSVVNQLFKDIVYLDIYYAIEEGRAKKRRKREQSQ